MAAALKWLVHAVHYVLRRTMPTLYSVWIERTPYGLPFPAQRHLTIEEDQIAGKKLLIIGDVHGCYDELVELLDQNNARDPNICVIFVGDLMNKGPKSDLVVKLAREMGAYCVRGNHEEVSLREWQKFNADPSTMREKFSWLQNLSAEDIKWAEELPFSIRIPSRKVIVVHAGMVPGVDLEEQSPDHLLHMRDLIYDADTSSWRGIKKPQVDSIPWGSRWPGPEHVYYGHDARRKLQRYEFATGLDTGCVYGGTLTAVFLSEGVKAEDEEEGEECLVSVNAHRVYEQPREKNNGNGNNSNGSNGNSNGL